jgi:SAM-dependent methyltransferase
VAAPEDVGVRGTEDEVGLTAGGAWLSRLLTLPSAAGRDLDDPETTALRRQIIRQKPFLRGIYEDWYRAIATAMPPGEEPVLELGSGGGFMQGYLPRVLASDILHVPGLDVVADARRLPFAAGALRGIVMTNVLHHIPDVGSFLADAARCVRPGGALVMIEPWVTTWSRLVYGRLHHEPFEPSAPDWLLPPGGPLSAANIALPWMVFQRDRARFEREFPSWQVTTIEPLMPFRYLISGGVSKRALMPAITQSAWRVFEHSLDAWMPSLGMFAKVVVVRTAIPASALGKGRVS